MRRKILQKLPVRSDIDRIRLQLDETLKLDKEGNYDGALVTSRSAYLDSYESIEIPLRPIDPDFTLEMEIKFAELRNLIQGHAPYAQVEAKVIEIRRGLDESERLVSGTGIVAPAIAFSTSFSIIFREGLESALIIGAIVTYLEASRNIRFKKHVYYGIVIAIGATAVTWFIAEFIIDISGASRELIEAIAGVSAVAVLFWVSFWVLNKIETKRWIEFVKAKVWKATATGSIMVFVLLSFFTVYREGFETVLFYQAMLSFAKYMELYVIAGLVVGTAVIVATAIVIIKLGRKLPLKGTVCSDNGNWCIHVNSIHRQRNSRISRIRHHTGNTTYRNSTKTRHQPCHNDGYPSNARNNCRPNHTSRHISWRLILLIDN